MKSKLVLNAVDVLRNLDGKGTEGVLCPYTSTHDIITVQDFITVYTIKHI